MPTPQQIQEARDAGRAEAAAEFSAAAAELAILRADLAQRRRAELGARITGWQQAGKLVPARAAGLLDFMVSIDAMSEPLEFTAPDGTQARKRPIELFCDFMDQAGPTVTLGRRSDGASGDADAGAVDPNNARAIARAAQDFQAAEAAAGRVIGIDQAVTHVLGGRIGLGG